MPQETNDQNEQEYKFDDSDDSLFMHDEEQPSAPEADGQEPGEPASPEEGDSQAEPQSPHLSSKRKLSRGKLVFTIIVLIVFILIVYKLVSIMHVSKHKREQRQQAVSAISQKDSSTSSEANTAKMPGILADTAMPSHTAQQAQGEPPGMKATIPAATDHAIGQPGFSTEPEKVSSPSGLSTTDKSIKAMSEHLASFDAKLLRLEGTNERLGDTLREQQAGTHMRLLSLEQKMAGLGSSLEQLQESISSLSHQVKTNKQLQRALLSFQKSQRVSKNKQIRQIKQYFVKAVIPGRAWLHGADGSMLTVTVGDHVPGYGQVVSINAYSGVVTMNTGIQIRYGLNS